MVHPASNRTHWATHTHTPARHVCEEQVKMNVYEYNDIEQNSNVT